MTTKRFYNTSVNNSHSSNTKKNTNTANNRTIEKMNRGYKHNESKGENFMKKHPIFSAFVGILCLQMVNKWLIKYQSKSVSQRESWIKPLEDAILIDSNSMKCDCQLHTKYKKCIRSDLMVCNPMHLRAIIVIDVDNKKLHDYKYSPNVEKRIRKINKTDTNTNTNTNANTKIKIKRKIMQQLCDSTLAFTISKSESDYSTLEWFAMHEKDSQFVLFVFESDKNNDCKKILKDWQTIVHQCINYQRQICSEISDGTKSNSTNHKLSVNNSENKKKRNGNNNTTVSMTIIPGTPWTDEQTIDVTKYLTDMVYDKLNNDNDNNNNNNNNNNIKRVQKADEYLIWLEKYIFNAWQVGKSLNKTHQMNGEKGKVFFLGINVSDMNDKQEIDTFVESVFDTHGKTLYQGFVQGINDGAGGGM